MIDGVSVNALKQIADDRGKVMHMLRADSPIFTKFGEVYFSLVRPGVVKAWKKHLKMTQNITVPVGKIRLVIYDDRKGSASFGKTEAFEIGEDNYVLLRIPPLVWYGFKGISKGDALITNCSDLPFDPAEVVRLEANDKTLIAYDWDK